MSTVCLWYGSVYANKFEKKANARVKIIGVKVIFDSKNEQAI